ncbi:hypothetical protein QYM36_012104 [Artemia franciscana]|uniref:HECT-type E3 ubiquitin transferase n=1 Tax=Artemia franciscana TaxID=6661 RepID=A0AA88HTJ4_ARTSF|nr:hypothetical protein QYM36_012104 [Artemia franciscana]
MAYSIPCGERPSDHEDVRVSSVYDDLVDEKISVEEAVNHEALQAVLLRLEAFLKSRSVSENQTFTLLWKNDVDDLGLQFTVDEAIDGYCKEVGLFEEGRFINVTNDNKNVYCDSMFSWKAGTSFIEEINGIIGGFNDIIPYELLSNSTARQLKDSLVGLQNIDVKDWKDCTTYSDYKTDDKIITLFWEFVVSFAENDKRQILKLWTGLRIFLLEDSGVFGWLIILGSWK